MRLWSDRERIVSIILKKEQKWTEISVWEWNNNKMIIVISVKAVQLKIQPEKILLVKEVTLTCMKKEKEKYSRISTGFYPEPYLKSRSSISKEKSLLFKGY